MPTPSGSSMRARGLALVDSSRARSSSGSSTAGVVAEDSRFITRASFARTASFFGPVREVEVAAVAAHRSRSRAVRRLEVLEAAADLGVEPARGRRRPQRSIHCERFSRPLAFWPWPPLRLEQPHAALVGLEHGRLDAVLLRQVERGRQAGGAGADDHDVGVDVVRDRAVVLRRRAGAWRPSRSARRRARCPGRRHQRVVARVVGLRAGRAAPWRCSSGPTSSWRLSCVNARAAVGRVLAERRS